MKYVIPILFLFVLWDFFRLSPQIFLEKTIVVTTLTVFVLGCQDLVRYINILIDDHKKGYDWREKFQNKSL